MIRAGSACRSATVMRAACETARPSPRARVRGHQVGVGPVGRLDDAPDFLVRKQRVASDFRRRHRAKPISISFASVGGRSRQCCSTEARSPALQSFKSRSTVAGRSPFDRPLRPRATSFAVSLASGRPRCPSAICGVSDGDVHRARDWISALTRPYIGSAASATVRPARTSGAVSTPNSIRRRSLADQAPASRIAS